MEIKTNYRPDIDGLRAIAVLSVVFYHAGVSVFSGGFVGVDVFFVISGYLITNIIVKELAAENFSLTNFYERRIRRIFPALFACLALTTAIAIPLFDSSVFLEFGKSLIATTFFVSNIYFWDNTGYFDAPSYLKPLLHTWSLAVEEQFYIFFPLLMMMAFRFFKKYLKVILLAVTFLSFALSEYFVLRDPSSGFYLTPLRAWELLLGSILAMEILPSKVNAKMNTLFSVAGIGLIFFAVFTYTPDTIFPGASALPPTIGAFLIIYSGIENNKLLNLTLGSPALVFIGKISYSLYLLHWPIIVACKYYLIKKPTVTDITGWLFIIFVASVASWRFVETPFRSKSFLKKTTIFKLATVSMLIASSFGILIYLKGGLPGRFKNQDLTIMHIADPGNKWGKCERKFADTATLTELCSIGADGEMPTFLVWGDSHAEALAPAINKSAKEYRASGKLVFNYGCPSLADIHLDYMDYCYGHNVNVLDLIKGSPSIRTVILVSRWEVFASRHAEEYRNTDNSSILAFGLQQTVAQLKKLNRNVVIVTQVPDIGYYVPAAYSIAVRTNRDLNAILGPTLDEYDKRNKLEINLFDSLEKEYDNLSLVNPTSALCRNGKCLVVLENNPLYRDDNHLSAYGSHYVSYVFDPLFLKISNSNIP